MDLVAERRGSHLDILRPGQYFRGLRLAFYPHQTIGHFWNMVTSQFSWVLLDLKHITRGTSGPT